MAWDDPKHEPPDRDPSIIDPGYGKPYPHHPAPAPSTPPPSDGGRQRAVRNPSAPSTPDPTPDPTPNVPPPTGSILPVPIYQQGPQRTDVFVPENKVPLPVIYGQQRVGAQVWYRKVQADNTEVVLYAICHGPINSISNILIEGKPITQFATIETYTGTSGQALSTIGSTAEPTLWTSALPYVAFVVAKFSNPSVTHTTPDVMRFTCDVQGMLVRDPRTDATLVNRYYRDNPALCLADLLSSPMHADANGNKYSYGAEVADAQLDWYGTITTAANDCNVLLADGVSKRFTMGLAMLDKKSIGDWIEAIRQHGQLMRPIYNNGLYQIVMDKAQASSGITLTSQGNSANIISCSPLVMKSSSQIPTRVIINFVNAAANYKNDSVQDDDPGIAGGTVEIVERTYEMGQIPYDQAKRLAKYLRKRASQQFSGVIRVNAEGLQLLPGIRVPVTSDQWNLGAADMIVSDLSSVAGGNDYASAWDASVEFYESGIYDDTQSTATPHAPPLSPSPYDPPADPTGITISPASPQYLGPVDHATLTYTTPATPFFETVEIYIEYSSDGGGSYGTKTHLSDAPTSPFTLPLFPSSSGVANSPGLYRLTFVTRTFAQQRSAGAIQTYQVNAASFGAGMVLSGMLAIGPATAGEPSGIACITTPTINDAARFFGFDSGGFERAAITTNSVWTGSVWNRDDVSKVAWRAEFDTAADNFSIYRAAAAANPVTWPSALLTLNNSGRLSTSAWLGLGNGGTPVGPSISNYTPGNQLLIAGGTGGTFIQNQGQTATLIAILNSGNVGIGTTPGAKLDVAGFIRSTSTAGLPATGAGAELLYGSDVATLQGFDRGASTYKELDLSGSSILGLVGGVEKLRLDSTGLHVGGGAASARLHVGAGGTGTNGEAIFIDSGSGTGGYAALYFLRNTTTRAVIGIAGSAGNFITGESVNDLAIRNDQTINFSANSGTTKHASLSNLGAWTFTAAAATGTVHSYIGTTTGSHFLRWTNTGGDLISGIDSSAGTQTGTAYAGFLWNIANKPLHFGTNNLGRLTITNDGHTLPFTTFSYDLGAPDVRWRSLYASELRVETLVAQKTIATIGGRILVGPTCKLVADIGTGATTITVDNNQMVSGDRVYMESAPGGVQQIEFMAITSAASANGSNWDYTVTRDLDASGANSWKAGDAVFNTGQTGNGFIDLYSVRGTKASTELGPTIVGNVRNSSTFNDWSPRWAIGNLNGLYGYATDTYGCAFGVPTAAWVKIDPTNGVRIGHNTTVNIQLDASGNASFTGSVTAASGTIGGFTIGATTMSATNLTFTSGAANTANITVGTGATAGGLNSANAGTDIVFWGGSTFANRATADFRVTAAGALTAANATITGTVTATAGAIGGFTITATELYAGSGATRVEMQAAGGFWAGATAFASAPFSVSPAGVLTATSGTIGGFTIGATELYAGTGATRVEMQSSGGFWAGATAFADAPFKVSVAGALTATSGAIGGWTLGATSLVSGSGATTVGLDSGGTNPAIYAGSATPSSAPFRVTNAGVLTAISGTIGGWSMSSTELKSGATTTTVGLNTDGAVNEAIYCGNATPASAPFRVFKNGQLVSTFGAIGGWTIGSTSLSSTNVTLSSASGGSITAGNVTIKNNEIDVSSTVLNFSGGELQISTPINVTTSITTGTVYASVVGGNLSASGNVVSANNYVVGSQQVVGARGAAVADNDGTLASVAAQGNSLAARMRTHGLIAT